MASVKIKVYREDKDTSTLIKTNFNEFKAYSDLRKKILDSKTNKNNKEKTLKEKDKFVLIYIEDKKNYYPQDLDKGIFDNKTFNYLKEKLILHEVKPDNTYKFYTTIVKKYPIWKKKENHEFLKKALDSSWNPIYNDIMAGINLSKLEESKSIYTKKKKELKDNEKQLKKETHQNIVCNNCFKKNFKGKRFICSECNNYNLCQDCEIMMYQRQIHQRDHTLIQVNKALKDNNLDDLYKYNNMIGNNNQEFKSVASSFYSEIIIINNGENDLKNCYILPVRYGDEYLSCSPKVVENEVPRNTAIKIGLIIRIPPINKGYFEGYFRMFTPHGLPFGDILIIKVFNVE